MALRLDLLQRKLSRTNALLEHRDLLGGVIEHIVKAEVLLLELLHAVHRGAVILPVASAGGILDLRLKMVILHLRHLQLVLEKLQLSRQIHALVVSRCINSTV